MALNTSSYLNGSPCTIIDNRTDIDFFKAHIPVIMVINHILPPIWWFVGIIGNTLALLVWLQPKMRHSSGCYLAALAISDLIFLPLNIVYEINHTYEKSLLDKTGLCEGFAVMYFTVQYMSPILVLAFTVERYLSVCHPFRMSRFDQSNIRVAILVILALTLFCIGLNGVQAYFWTAKDDVCALRAVVIENKVWIYTTWVVEALISTVVPLTVLLLNVLVIVEVRKISNLERQNMRTNSIDRRSTTLMLLGVSFYLIFTILPVTIIYILYYLYTDIEDRRCFTDDQIRNDPAWNSYFHYQGARFVIQNLGMSHYAANFFIYLATGKLFRKQLKEMFASFCCKQKLLHLTVKTGIYTNTKTTRMSLTSHRGSVARNRLSNAKTGLDPCNNDTDLCNKNTSTDIEVSTMNGGHGVKHDGAASSRLLTCVEESDVDASDKEEVTAKMTP